MHLGFFNCFSGNFCLLYTKRQSFLPLERIAYNHLSHFLSSFARSQSSNCSNTDWLAILGKNLLRRAQSLSTDLWHLLCDDIYMVSWSDILFTLCVQRVMAMMLSSLLLFLLFLLLVFLQFLFMPSFFFQFHILVRHRHSCRGRQTAFNPHEH